MTRRSTPRSLFPASDIPMPIELDVSECLKQAREFIDLANVTENPELRGNYLELAKHYTQLAGLMQRATEE